MGGGPSSDDEGAGVTTHSSESDQELVRVDLRRDQAGARAVDADAATTSSPATLLYAKSKVYIHPTAYSRENQPGWITLVRRAKADYLLSWIPERLLKEEERDLYVKVEIGEAGPVTSEDVKLADSILNDSAVSTTSAAAKYAWSVPLSAVYSLFVTPPTLANWYGNVSIYLTEDYTQTNPNNNTPTHKLFFHDDESPSTMLMMDRRSAALAGRSQDGGAGSSRLPASWGGEDLISALKRYSNVVRSSLQTTMYLVNPSQTDLEAHSVPLYEDELPDAASVLRYRQQRASQSGTPGQGRNSILHQSLSPQASSANSDALPTLDNLTFSVLNSFSRLTNRARSTAQNIAHPILSHPLSKPILKHLPPPIASLANANATEYSSWAEKAGVAGYDAARVYLARWARVVAEEGERARRSEMNFTGRRSGSAGAGGNMGAAAATAEGLSADTDDDNLGGSFEVLATTYRISRPRSTRVQGSQPIVKSEWEAYFDTEGRLMLSAEEARKRIFQRGLAADARKEAWPSLLGVYEWDSSASERSANSKRRKDEYEKLKGAWFGKKDVTSTEQFIEEHHRIQIDCLRTDRNQPMFASTAASPTGDASKTANLEAIRQSSMAASMIDPTLRGDANGQPESNYHVERLIEVLLTYNVWETELGYVQGMSDLCSPIYIVMDGDESLTFWCFVNLMEQRMKPNFYRDQSGIKHQLTLLQQLIALMDPGLHTHLEETDSLNLFFCFRWILIAFKREFKFEDCLSVWETLWSAPCLKFHLFLALSILEKHRNIIIRYLQEFDEVLKYVNELSQTLDPQPLLSQAEVLYLGFRNLVEATDRRRAERASLLEAQGRSLQADPFGSASGSSGLTHRRVAATTSGPDPVAESGKAKGKTKDKETDPLIQLVREEADAEANVPDLEISADLRELLSM